MVGIRVDPYGSHPCPGARFCLRRCRRPREQEYTTGDCGQRCRTTYLAQLLSIFPAVQKHHGSHPDRGGEISGDDVTGIVHAEVNPREANRQHQQPRARPDGDACEERANATGKQARQNSVDTERKKRMSAGKARSAWRGTKKRSRPGSVEAVFQRQVEKQSARQRHHQPQRGPAPPPQKEQRQSDHAGQDQSIGAHERNRKHSAG